MGERSGAAVSVVKSSSIGRCAVTDLWEVRRVQTGGYWRLGGRRWDRRGNEHYVPRFIIYRLYFAGRFCESFLTKKKAERLKVKRKGLHRFLCEEVRNHEKRD